MAIQSNLPGKRSDLDDLIAAALRGEKVVIAVDGGPKVAAEPDAPKPDEDQAKPESS